MKFLLKILFCFLVFFQGFLLASPSVRATSTSTPDNSQNSDISLPSGTQVGDLLILHVGIGDDRNITQPSGFTEIDNTRNGSQRGALYWKIATSTETSAGSVTVEFSDTTENIMGMYAITDFDATTPIDQDNVNTGNSSSMTTAGVTVTNDDSMVILFTWTEDNNTHSGYQIANDNPSWTEGYDVDTSIGNDYSIASGYGVKSSTGATGTSTITSSAADDYVAHIISINPEEGGGDTGGEGRRRIITVY